VPSTKLAFGITKYLCRNDVAVSDFGILINFKCAKTNHFDHINVILPMYKNDKFDLCPVAAFFDMRKLVPAASLDHFLC
jgi:hypothetical protein